MIQSPPVVVDPDERHRQRMARKKALIDAAIQQANRDQGLLLVLTGNGKGKSTSAFGMLARALGHGLTVGVCQFIKGRSDTGEEAFFRRQPGVIWHVLGEGFTWDTQDRVRDTAVAQAGWRIARELLSDTKVGLLVLDELTYCLNDGYLDTGVVLADLAARPPGQHVVITGRAAPTALIEVADTVTELRDVAHAYRAGVRAQAGVDY